MIKISKDLYYNIQSIMEGGNIAVMDKDGNKVKADHVTVTKNSRSQVANDIHGALSDIHDTFEQTHGKPLYGAEKRALHSRSAFSGSTSHLMNPDISHQELTKHKTEFGDIDSKIPEEHIDALHGHLTPGKKFGKYTVVGTKRSGSELHALMRHENGQVHQFDFEKSKYKNNEPTSFDKFGHSSDWNDTKNGIKGMHHKILLNLAGGTKYKFSNQYGLGNREGDPNWDSDTHSITHKLFGKEANESHLHSFHGLTHLIKHHLPKSHHQEIVNRFRENMSKQKGDHSAPITHLQRELKVV